MRPLLRQVAGQLQGSALHVVRHINCRRASDDISDPGGKAGSLTISGVAARGAGAASGEAQRPERSASG